MIRLYAGRRLQEVSRNDDGDRISSQIRSVLRIVAALLFLQHGSAKLLHVPYQAMFAHLQLTSLLGVQGVIELVGGGLLAIGLFSRPVAFLLCGDMAVAFFKAHFPKSWLPLLNGGDLAVLFCFTFSVSVRGWSRSLEPGCAVTLEEGNDQLATAAVGDRDG